MRSEPLKESRRSELWIPVLFKILLFFQNVLGYHLGKNISLYQENLSGYASSHYALYLMYSLLSLLLLWFYARKYAERRLLNFSVLLSLLPLLLITSGGIGQDIHIWGLLTCFGLYLASIFLKSSKILLWKGIVLLLAITLVLFSISAHISLAVEAFWIETTLLWLCFYKE